MFTYPLIPPRKNCVFWQAVDSNKLNVFEAQSRQKTQFKGVFGEICTVWAAVLSHHPVHLSQKMRAGGSL
jgi:hypothetical protein